MIRLFTGWDARESIGFGTFCQSVMSRSTSMVSITPLHSEQFDGSNAFTYARYLVPSLCNHTGWAIFADGCDMVCLDDITKLWLLRDPQYAVQVVRHDYKTNAPIKYKGTSMESKNVDYPRKNWSSLMLVNCAHPSMRTIGMTANVTMHQFHWLQDHEIGSLPMEWNWLCDEYGPSQNAKILHWTQGIPGFAWYKQASMADRWWAEHEASQGGHGL